MFPTLRCGIFLILLCSLSTTLWATETSVQEAVCAKATSLNFPPQDMPTAAEKASLKDCDSIALYYDARKTSDYVAARKCAFYKADPKLDDPYYVLMMVYANGYGVQKNLDLAIKSACLAGGAYMETEERIKHLTELKTKPADQPLKVCLTDKSLSADYCIGKVDMCDDITSGYMQGKCEGLASAREEEENSRQINKVVVQWPEDQQRAFAELNKAARAYFEEHAGNEIDASPSVFYAYYVEEEDNMRKDFAAKIAGFDAKKIPSFSPHDYIIADHALNDVYRLTLKKKFDTNSRVSAGGIRSTQRLWLIYRDAWVKFAALHYPDVSADSIKTWLTQERTEVLKNIQVNADD